MNTPVLTPCPCGYQDRRFCPTHGRAPRAVVRAGSDFGAVAAAQVSAAFADPAVERVCVACVVGKGAHETWCEKGAAAR